MQIQKFMYSGREREVLVSESDGKYVRGIDLTALQNPETVKILREDAPFLELQTTEGRKHVEYVKDRPQRIEWTHLMGAYRNFLAGSCVPIKPPSEESGE